jgi:3-oxoacyl-[acyl-carrier-protein] synthase II
MKAFINSTKSISPQDTFYGSFPMNEVRSYVGQLAAIEPNYKDFINPMKLRRMNRIIRMGLTTAIACLKDAGIEKPDGIISATGWGCLADTFSFLDEIRDKKEEALSPATFIQSTHNTIGGHIALSIDCQEYNNVIVNHTTSFEQSLMEALLLIAEGKSSVLVGGLDELAQQDIELKRLAGYWKEKETDNLSLFKSISNGTLPGEGAAYFLLGSVKSVTCYSQIDEVFFCTADSLKAELSNRSKPDFILSGFNGDKRLLPGYPELEVTCIYKHLCGDYDTASSFALWLTDQIIKAQKIPPYLLLNNDIEIPQQINRILIHHFTEPDQHAFIMVSKAGA